MSCFRRTSALMPALILIGALIAATPGTTVRPSAPEISLVLDGVTVVDVEKGTLASGQRVVLKGSRIQAVGAPDLVSLPKGARVVDAREKYLIPGLWDMHTHVIDYARTAYPLLIANGVTGIRDAAGAEVPLDTVLQWRRDIAAGARVGPRQFVAGGFVHEHRGNDQSRKFIQVSVAADARRVVDSLQASGADQLKLHELTHPALYFAFAAEARRMRIPFGGHLPAELGVTMVQASDSGHRFFDHFNSSGKDLSALCIRHESWARHRFTASAWRNHGDSASVATCRTLAQQLARNGSWFVPTILITTAAGLFERGPGTDVAERYLSHAGQLDHYAPISLARYARFGPTLPVDSASARAPRSGVMEIMQHAGMPILAGTDVAPDFPNILPGFSLHAELAILVAEGLTPLEALRAATVNPAKAFHATDSLGTIAPGKLADLVLLEANPLEDITNTEKIFAVVANGRYFGRAALDQLLAEVRTKAQAP